MAKVKPELVERLHYAAETAAPEVAALLREAAMAITDFRVAMGDYEDEIPIEEELDLLIMPAAGHA